MKASFHNTTQICICITNKFELHIAAHYQRRSTILFYFTFMCSYGFQSFINIYVNINFNFNFNQYTFHEHEKTHVF
jgi:hypothetical protein